MSSSSSSSSSLPPGWENRSNSMSEKDIKLGGIAATKFGNKNIINTAYSDTTTIQEVAAVYKTSDEVRDVYLKQMDIQQKQQQANNHNNTENNKNTENNTKYVDEDETIRTNANNANANATNNEQTTTPLFWEERQKTRQLEAEGYRNKDNNNNNSNNTQNSSNINSNSKTMNPTIAKSSANNNAKLALLRIAIHTLETLADTFEQEQEQEQTAHTQTVNTAIIPMEDKTAFAKAIQRSMQALASNASASSTD